MFGKGNGPIVRVCRVLPWTCPVPFAPPEAGRGLGAQAGFKGEGSETGDRHLHSGVFEITL